MKNFRHNRILEIINEYNIETQEDLIEKLRESGYDVTQATVSRDIKQLRLIKTAAGNGGYKYTAPRREDSQTSARFKNILHETAISAQNAENIVVIKTYPGMANAAAAAIDALASDTIVGSIAGDDTIFIVTHDDESAENFTNFIKTVIDIA